MAVDITEVRKAQIQLQGLADDLAKTNERQSEFFATLAHELRNPLAPIRTGLELMAQAGAANTINMAQLRAMMERQVDQLAHLVGDLMDVARINSGKVELKLTQTSVAQAIAAAVETSLPQIEAGRHTLITGIPDNALLVNADPARLAQILGNILTNAAKYTPPGGRIEVRACREDDQVAITISDNGVGISQAAQQTVFDMFTQASGSSGRSQGGLGIGLSLVKRLVELHNGTVTVQSEGEGKGSAFTVRLPALA